MDVDLPSHAMLQQMVMAALRGRITLDAARTNSALEPTALIKHQHMKSFADVLTAPVDLVGGPLRRKKQDEASFN